jgi:hypothetical protein
VREPTRDECERRFPQLKVDANWELHPVVGQDGDHVGFVCIYYVDARCFATRVFKARPSAEKGEKE